MTSEGFIVDLFAGPRPGGWDEGLRQLGRTDVIGFELDRWACATRAAAGHKTIRADVTTWPLERLVGRVEGLIASPPCPDWSMAGSRKGRDGTTGHLVDEPWRWIDALAPEWVAMEQVPPALPVWLEYAHRLRGRGYSAWAGVVCASSYGLAQDRYRAVLLASRLTVATPPHPTHGGGSLFGALPAVTMAEGLGWEEAGTSWPYRAPATTVCGDPRITARCHHEAGSQGANAKTTEQVRAGDYDGTEPIRLTLEEAATLQGFEDYPWRGNKGQRFQQIGNAVAPPFAAALLSELIESKRAVA